MNEIFSVFVARNPARFVPVGIGAQRSAPRKKKKSLLFNSVSLFTVFTECLKARVSPVGIFLLPSLFALVNVSN